MATLVAGDVFGAYTGYYQGVAGSLSTEIFPSGTTLILLSGVIANRISASVSGNQVSSLAGLTHLKVDGVNYAVTSAPNYVSGNDATDMEFGPFAGFTVGNSYAVELVGVGGGGPTYDGPTWVGKSTALGSTAAGNIDFTSSGRASGDQLFIAIASANQAITAPSGFTEVANSPQFRGTAAAAGGIRLAVFQKTSDGTETTVTIADPGDHVYAVGFVIRPKAGEAVAIDASAGKNAAAGTAHSGNTLTSTVDNCLIVDVWGTDRDSAGPSYSAQANAGLDSLTEQHDAGTTSGVGSGIVIYSGGKITAGSVAATTATSAASVAYCAITLALKSVSAGGAQTLTPSVLTNTQTFYSATVTRGAVTLTPSLFTNAQTFHAPTVSAGAVNLTPPLLTNDAAFFSPTVTLSGGPQTLTPSLFTNSTTFHAPTVTRGVVTLTPPQVVNSQTFYSPTVTREAVTLSPPLVSNSQTFYAPTVTAGPVTLTPSLLTNTTVFYSPTVSGGPVTLTPPLLTNDSVIFAPVVSQSSVGQTVTPPLLTNVSTFYAPMVVRGAVTLAPSLLTNTTVFYSPTVVPGSVTLSPPLLTESATFFAPSVTSSVTLTPPLVVSTTTFFAPLVVQGPVTLSVPLIANDNEIFPPLVRIATGSSLARAASDPRADRTAAGFLATRNMATPSVRRSVTAVTSRNAAGVRSAR